MAQGGARKGAGRPSLGSAPKVQVNVRLDEAVAAELRTEAETRKVSQAQVIEDWGQQRIYNRDAIDEVRQLLEDAVSIDRKAHVSREAIREALELLERIR